MRKDSHTDTWLWNCRTLRNEEKERHSRSFHKGNKNQSKRCLKKKNQTSTWLFTSATTGQNFWYLEKKKFKTYKSIPITVKNTFNRTRLRKFTSIWGRHVRLYSTKMRGKNKKGETQHTRMIDQSLEFQENEQEQIEEAMKHPMSGLRKGRLREGCTYFEQWTNELNPRDY